MNRGIPIGEYLIQRLYAHGVRHVFGIPGDYVLTLEITDLVGKKVASRQTTFTIRK